MADWGSSRIFYDSDAWRALSKRVRSRDRWTCRECGFRAVSDWQRRHMQAHHVVSRPHVATRTALDNESNLVCLCRTCHEAIHGHPTHHAARPAAPNTRAMRAPRPHGPPSFRSGRR